MRECLLDELPKYKDGRYKNKVQWQNSNGCKIKFVYDSVQGEFIILNYNKKNQTIEIKYNEEIYKLATSQILNCSLGGIVLEKLNNKEYEEFIKEWKIKNIKNKSARKLFFENLELSKGLIDWKNSVGKKVYFIYKNIEGYIDIIDYKNGRLFIKYKDYDVFEIGIGQVKDCQLGKMLKFNTDEFKIEIGQVLKDDKRDMTIIDREHRDANRTDGKSEKRKWYKYICNKCGWTQGWAEENHLLGRTGGCSCCHNFSVVEGINDIPTTNSWMIPYFQGGYNEAKRYSFRSEKMIIPICPDCGKIRHKSIRISDIYKNKGFKCICSDGISIPNKILLLLLEQLKTKKEINFYETEKKFEWSNDRIYDGYINDNIIIEMHGSQHYRNVYRHKKARNLKEEQENDKLKKELAMNNNIEEYIEINCNNSEFKYIKENILNSKLNELFNLSIIDWNYIDENIHKNLVKVACELKQNNLNLTTFDIGEKLGVTHTTIGRYLKIGTRLGWCKYDSQEERNKANIKRIKTNSIPIICINNEKVYKSASFCSSISKQEFGINLIDVGIRYCCYGKYKHTKGYQFKYIKDLTPEEYIKYDIENKLKELHNEELVQAC